MDYKEMYDNGWRKVYQSGGSYAVAVLFNINTKESITITVRDYDYAYGSRANVDWYYAPVDETAAKMLRYKFGIIEAGDMVKVVRGRKVQKGYTGRVIKIQPIRDIYGRRVADYAVFEDGTRTNVDNCELVND